MVFNSYTFIIFFLVVLALCRSAISWRSKKTVLLVSSYLFYAAWSPPFVLLIWLSTVVDWYIARGIASSVTQRRKKLLVTLSLFTNLGLLAYFKYGNFVLDNFTVALSGMGIEYAPAAMDIILPVGISFYTFQTLSYTLDVYRGHLKPWNDFLDYALFVTFFPQLVAGPIVRAADFLPQTTEERRANSAQLGWGLSLIVLGLFQKVVIADGLLAPIVEKVFDSSLSPAPLAAGVGTLAFAGQIFCDFAGYSTIAIGTAMCLGFALCDNFKFPYGAIGFSDFWRRWHISLSTWLRDYLYISLGGNRVGEFKRYRNLMITMLLGGLWHGASWNFVIWGLLHGLYLVIELGLTKWIGHFALWRNTVVRIGLSLITFAAVCFAWIFFRANSLERSFEIVAGLSTFGPRELYVSPADAGVVGLVMGFMLLVHGAFRNLSLEDAARRAHPVLKTGLLALMIIAIFTSPGEDRAFIYFQF